MTALVDLYNRDHAALVAWVVREYGLVCNSTAFLSSGMSYNVHALRREAIAQRVRLYRDDWEVDFDRMIDLIFETDTVKSQRKKLYEVACEQNVSRRIVDEVASLYDRPALRVLRQRNDAFRELAIDIELDEVMQEAHRLTFLCNETLLWLCEPLEPGAAERLHVLTSDLFDAIPHPKDKLVAAGFRIDMAPIGMVEMADSYNLPHHELWDDTFRYLISADGRMVDEYGQPVNQPIEHGLGTIPGILLHRRKPVDRLLDARQGSDIVSAHLGVGLLEAMIMRLAKSQGERQPVLRGNLANVAAGQPMDGERPIVLPPEVVAEILDTRTEPDHYITAKKDKITAVAQTYGMSYEQYTRSDTSDTGSGKAYQVRREKLTELRGEQRRRALLHERMVARLLGFDPTGLRVDFQEQAIPQDAAEKVALLRDKMRYGLDSPVAFVMRENPDFSREEAIAWIQANLRDFALVILLVRALNAPADGSADNPGQSAQDNGAMGGPNDSSGQPAGYLASGDTTQIDPETGMATAA